MRLQLATLVLTLAGASLAAEEIRVMSAGAVEAGLVALASDFERQSGHTVAITFGTAPQLTSRLQASEPADVLVAPVAVMDAAAAASRIDVTSRRAVGRVGVGVVVRRGADAPDVSSPDALRRALLAARAVVYNRGSTGQYVDGLFARLGVSDQVAAKTTRFDSGDQVMERLAAGVGDEIGFGAIPDIRLRESAGVRLVAPLPAAIQNYTVYQAAVLSGSRVPTLAAGFLAFVTSPDARQRFAAGGIEAVD